MLDFVGDCEQAARTGARVLMSWVGRFTAREKAPADLVTEADLASQQAIRELLLGRYPDHDFLGEEPQDHSTADKEASRPHALAGAGRPRYRWVVDPLDGTINYAHGLSGYSVSVALEQDGVVIAGCVFDPLTQECFTASRGGGARVNGRPLTTSTIPSLEQGLVVVSLQANVRADAVEIQHTLQILQRCQSLRRLGSTALNLCYLADGRLDGYFSGKSQLWDFAAGMLILLEAGGVVSNWAGQPFDPTNPYFVAAGNTSLHQQLLDCIQAEQPKPS